MFDDNVRGSPPPKTSRRIIVHRVTTSESQEFCILSKAPWGYWVHWHGNRSHECSKDVSRCEGCADNWPAKWKGYLHALTDLGRSHVFLEITSTLFHMLTEKIPKGEDWRGLRVRIRKTKGGPKGRYLVEVLESRASPDELPAEIDPLQTLRALWRSKKGPSPEPRN